MVDRAVYTEMRAYGKTLHMHIFISMLHNCILLSYRCVDLTANDATILCNMQYYSAQFDAMISGLVEHGSDIIQF
ncbi:hypothetical protein VNO78_23279 [Psophocarpus tetragonolobus]|uniref:Uncharacterized protein n=1 Tax=Psophocarpus tetragonolobus TaxID=3891 RepID=A0AAN9S395_PSOTE